MVDCFVIHQRKRREKGRGVGEKIKKEEREEKKAFNKMTAGWRSIADPMGGRGACSCHNA